MKTSALSGLASAWMAVLAIAAPLGVAQAQSGRSGARVERSERTPTAEEAAQLQGAGRWEAAASAWEEIVERDPENGRAVFNLGYCLHMAGRIEEAIEVHERAARFDGYQGIALYNAGCAYALLGERDAAIDALTESKEAGFDFGIAREDSDLDSLRGDPRFEALLEGTSAGADWRAHVEALAGRARGLYEEYAPVVKRRVDGVLSRAEAQGRELFGRLMQDQRFRTAFGRAMQFVGEHVHGAGAAPAGVPQEAAPTFSLRDAQRLQQAGEWEAAAHAFGAVLEREPENAAAAFGYAYCVHMSGDYDTAIRAHKRAASFPETRGIALYNLACAYALTGQPDKALQALRASREAGFDDMPDLIESDSDLDSLREDERFQRFVESIRKGA